MESFNNFEEKDLFCCYKINYRNVGSLRGLQQIFAYIYKFGYVKGGSTAFKAKQDGCSIPSAAREILGPEGLLMR